MVYRKPEFCAYKYRYMGAIEEGLTTEQIEELAAITEEQVEDLREEFEQAIERNDEEYARRCERYDEMLAIAKELYGENSNTYRYLTKKDNKPTKWMTELYFRSNPDGEFRAFVKAVNDAREYLEKEKEDAERKAKREQRRKERLEAAVAFLTERGMTIGEDFSLEEAPAKADDIALEEEIERMKTELRDARKEHPDTNRGYLSFDGDDYCSEDCRGWDGESHRCECGNRRIYWGNPYGFTFEEPHIRPMVH